MAVVFDQNSERGFVYGSLVEFMKCWENGANSRLVLESCNGYAWLNMTCCLGRPHESHVRKKSRHREERDNARAAAYNEKIRNNDDKNVNVVKDAIDEGDAKNVQIDSATEEVKDNEKTIEGFVDCSISVKSSAMCDYNYSMEKHEEMNGALNDIVTKYLSDEFPEVEVSKIDFSSRYTNEWYYQNKERAVARDHKFRVNFKQKDLSKKNFSDVMKNLMKAQTYVPVPEGKNFVVLGKKENDKRKPRVHLDQLVLVDNNR